MQRLLCFVETKYLQCWYISKAWLYILISNGYILCSEHGNIETKYLQCNVATFLRHDYIYSHFLPSSVGSVDSSEWNGLDINCSSNSQPCRELNWHDTESSYGHLLGLWLHFMGSSFDVSPLGTSSTLGLLYSAVVPYDSYYACNIWICTCSRKNYILQSIYWHSKAFCCLHTHSITQWWSTCLSTNCNRPTRLIISAQRSISILSVSNIYPCIFEQWYPTPIYFYLYSPRNNPALILC